MSRTAVSRRNALWAVAGSFSVTALQFVIRTAIVRELGVDFLALHAILTNLNALLLVLELGVGVALTYRLLQAIKAGDPALLSHTRNLGRRVYRAIFLGVLAMGVVLAPAIPYLGRDLDIAPADLMVAYALFVITAAITASIDQNRVLFAVNQQNFVFVKLEVVVGFCSVVFQMVVVYLTASYVFMLVIVLLQFAFLKVVSTKRARLSFPHAFQTTEHSASGSDTWRLLVQDIRNMAIFRVSAAALNASDGILIAVLLSASLTAVWSNYALIVAAITTLAMAFLNSLNGPIGNQIITASRSARDRVFDEASLICLLMFSFAAIGLATCLTSFIRLWMGESFVLGQIEVLAMVGAVFLSGSNQITSQYRGLLGLFHAARAIPLLAMIVKLSVSFLFVHWMGLIGIFLATIVARLVSFSTIDPILVVKRGMGRPLTPYFVRQGVVAALTGLAIFLASASTTVFDLAGFSDLLTRLLFSIMAFSCIVAGPMLVGTRVGRRVLLRSRASLGL